MNFKADCICLLCTKTLTIKTEHSGRGIFDLYICKDCHPDSLYRQLYYYGKTEPLLVDSIKVGSYHVIRYFYPIQPNGKTNFTVIHKDILGYLDYGDIEPLTMSNSVCEIDHVVDLPIGDVPALLRKFDIWTLFS